MPHTFSGLRAHSGTAVSIQRPPQFEPDSVKKTVFMTARLGGLGGLECALIGQTLPEIGHPRFRALRLRWFREHSASRFRLARLPLWKSRVGG
jgi:hypothetical protein